MTTVRLPKWREDFCGGIVAPPPALPQQAMYIHLHQEVLRYITYRIDPQHTVDTAWGALMDLA